MAKKQAPKAQTAKGTPKSTSAGAKKTVSNVPASKAKTVDAKSTTSSSQAKKTKVAAAKTSAKKPAKVETPAVEKAVPELTLKSVKKQLKAAEAELMALKKRYKKLKAKASQG